MVKQVSVFLENQSGRLAEVTRILGQNDIDIRALYVADTTDFGILRMLVDKPQEATILLTKAGFTVKTTPVIAIALEDVPGKLDEVLMILSNNDISMDYLYAFVGHVSTEAIVVIRVDELEKALKIFNQNQVRILSSEEVYGI